MIYRRIALYVFFILVTISPKIILAKELNASTLSFQNSTIHFSAIKSKTEFSFSDDLGTRTLKIQKCNENVINDFWMKMVRVVNNTHGISEKNRAPSSSAWVNYEGIQVSILNFDPALHFFNNVPTESHILFSESKRLCRKK